MAHIGRNYKVHFRRDVCLGCINYVIAFPEAWIANSGWTTTESGGTVYLIEDILVRPTTPYDEAMMEWESDDITQHGRTFNVRIRRGDHDFSTGRTQILFELMSGGVLRARRDLPQFFAQQCNRYGNQFTFTPWTDVDTSYWGGSFAGTAQTNIAAADWLHWPE